MKRLLLLIFSFLFAASLADAATRSRRIVIRRSAQPAGFRIELTNGESIFSRDLPVHRGSVVLFHRASDGALTGLPEEEVAGVVRGTADTATVRSSAASAAEVAARPLEPGEALVLGPTGEGAGSANAIAGNGANGVAAPPNGAVPYFPAPYG